MVLSGDVYYLFTLKTYEKSLRQDFVAEHFIIVHGFEKNILYRHLLVCVHLLACAFNSVSNFVTVSDNFHQTTFVPMRQL